MKKTTIVLIICLIIVLFTLTQCSPAVSTTTSSSTLDGKTLVETKCTKCHTIERIQSASKDAAGWKSTVERMVGKGAELTPDEQAIVIDYLSATYP